MDFPVLRLLLGIAVWFSSKWASEPNDPDET